MNLEMQLSEQRFRAEVESFTSSILGFALAQGLRGQRDSSWPDVGASLKLMQSREKPWLALTSIGPIDEAFDPRWRIRIQDSFDGVEHTLACEADGWTLLAADKTVYRGLGLPFSTDRGGFVVLEAYEALEPRLHQVFEHWKSAESYFRLRGIGAS